MTETYAYLTKLGIMNGYCVIPEYPLPTGKQLQNKVKDNKIDLVFAKKKEVIKTPTRSNLDVWEVHYAIEIDGVDVQGWKQNSTFLKHANNYDYLFQNQATGVFKKGINILYYHAYHRTTDPMWSSLFRVKWQSYWQKNYNTYKNIALNYPHILMEIYLSEYYQLPVILSNGNLFNW